MIILNSLEKWFEKNSQKLKDREIVFEFSKVTETDNPAQFVDVDTKTKIARVTIWKTGHCDFEVLENETAKQIIFKHQVIKSENQLFDFLEQVFSEL